MSRFRLRSVLLTGLFLLVFVVAGQMVWADEEDGQAVGTIAYARSNEIRLIGSDGMNDRPLWQQPLPEGAKGIRGLQWRPDGGALAFGSGY